MRVITGTARGRRLREPEGMATRPTTDNVKESMFNLIQFDIEGRRVLDLFAGTGQLGIEARAAPCSLTRAAPPCSSCAPISHSAACRATWYRASRSATCARAENLT